MRIRKQPPRGSAAAAAAAAIAGEPLSGANQPRPGSQEQEELVQSSRGVKEKPELEPQMLRTASEAVIERISVDEGRQVPVGIERVGSFSRSAFTWLDKLRHSKGFTETEPYSNLEDFIAFLSKEGGSSSKGRTRSHEEGLEETGLLSPLVGNARELARYNSVCSEFSSKQANDVGPEGTALVSCDEHSSMSASLAQGGRHHHHHHQLRSDASLPSAFRHNCSVKDGANVLAEKDSDASGVAIHDASKEGLHVSTTKNDKQKGERQTNTAWMQQKGASSEGPMHHEIMSGTLKGPCSDNSLSQLATVEAGFKQGHDSSVAQPVETRFGTLPQNDQIGVPTDTAERRSDRNRKIPSFSDAETWHETLPATVLSPDHPALQPKDSLESSLYTTCLQVGMAGLTAREALSEMLERGYTGLEQGAVQSSRRIAKLLRNSPYYMELGEGKFALCSAFINTEQTISLPEEPPPLQSKPAFSSQRDFRATQLPKSSASSEPGRPKRRQIASMALEDSQPLPKNPESSHRDHLGFGATQHHQKPSPSTERSKRRQTVSVEAAKPESEVKVRPGRTGRPKKLKYMKQENADELGGQCNRTDGKGWVCPLLAKPGYQLCDHHLDKLRCKPGSRSKKNKNNSNSNSNTLELGTPAGEPAIQSATTTTTTAIPITDSHAGPHLDTAGHENHTIL